MTTRVLLTTLVGAVLMAVLVAGVLSVTVLTGAASTDAVHRTAEVPPPAPSTAQAGGPAPAALGIAPPDLAAPLRADASPPPAPQAIRIPAIGVDHALVALAVDATGVLVPPESAADPGWFTGSVVPGEIGPSIIAGHVDSKSGPGVFYRLGRLSPGDEIDVQRPDGVEHFRVRSTQTIGKGEFPTASVYGPVPVPELRLITCGGDFSRATGHYVDNVIVRADLVPTSMLR